MRITGVVYVLPNSRRVGLGEVKRHGRCWGGTASAVGLVAWWFRVGGTRARRVLCGPVYRRNDAGCQGILD